MSRETLRARQNLMELNKPRLIELIARVREKGADKFGVVCINVDDAAWRWFVDSLMPEHDWDQFRRLGQTPVARGVVPRDVLVDIAAKVCEVYVSARVGVVVAVFDAGGISIYDGDEIENPPFWKKLLGRFVGAA